MFLFASLLLLSGSGNDFAGTRESGPIGPIRTLLAYEPVPEEAGELTYLLDLAHAADGSLAALDRDNYRVYLWRPDGSFEGAFGRKGQGPGELKDPLFLTMDGTEVFIFNWGGNIDVFGRADRTYRRRMRIVSIHPQVFRLMAGQQGRSLMVVNLTGPKGPITCHLIDVISGEAREITALQHNLEKKLWVLASLGDPKEPIPIGQPRVWVAARPSGGFLYGFSGRKGLHILDAEGLAHGRMELELPETYPGEQDREAFMNTGIAPLRTSLRTFEKQLGAGIINIDMSIPMSPYTHFLPREDDILFFI